MNGTDWYRESIVGANRKGAATWSSTSTASIFSSRSLIAGVPDHSRASSKKKQFENPEGFDSLPVILSLSDSFAAFVIRVPHTIHRRGSHERPTLAPWRRSLGKSLAIASRVIFPIDNWQGTQGRLKCAFRREQAPMTRGDCGCVNRIDNEARVYQATKAYWEINDHASLVPSI